MAFSLSPKKYFNGKFCFNCLNSNSICHRSLYMAAIKSALSSNRLVKNSNSSATARLHRVAFQNFNSCSMYY